MESGYSAAEVSWVSWNREKEFKFCIIYQQYISWSPSLEIEPATKECRVETLPLSYWSTSNRSVAKIDIDNAWPINLGSFVVTSIFLLRTRSPPGLCLPKKIGDTHPRNHKLIGKKTDIHFFRGEDHGIDCWWIPHKVETAV